MAQDTVKIEKNGKTATVVKSSYERVWKGLGWAETKDEKSSKTAAPTTKTSAPGDQS